MTGLAAFVEAPGWALPDASAPARFARLLAEVIPDWQVEAPDANDTDLHLAAIAPDASGRTVAVTVDWPTGAGYRDIDQWRVTGYGTHRVVVEMQLCHDAGPAEFGVALRLLRATWATHEHLSGPPEGTAGRGDVMNDAFSNAKWFKSSKSGAAGHCVEAAFLENNTIGVRDSKNPSGPALTFTAPEWDAFVAGAKAGEFDRR